MLTTRTSRVINGVLASGILRFDVEKGLVYSSRWRKGTIPLGCTNSKGYRVCTLHHNGERAQVKIHQLIWICVHGTIPDGLVPDHRSRVKHDNSISNLRLVAQQQNSSNRRSYVGIENPAAKINQKTAEEIRRLHNKGQPYSRLKTKFNISASLVAKICRGELWTN